jgi:hypothetical protein
MKYFLIPIVVLIFFSCEKKKTERLTDSSTPASTGSTTGNPQPPEPPFAADLIVTNTDHNYSYGSAHFYGTTTLAIVVDAVKLNGQVTAQVPGNEYRYTNSSSNFTGTVLWEIFSSTQNIPDTSLYSPPFPNLGFTKNSGLTYDKTQDFNIPVDVTGCDSMFITLGTVLKKVAGNSGTTSITFKPADGVKADPLDNTQVVVDVSFLNYSVITVRGKKWKQASATTAQSHYNFK